MKKYLIVLLLILGLTGCFKRDDLENVTIYTTNYPIEYITERLYGENSDILSIYPNNIIIKDYKLTDKQLSDYSKGKIFIYNGLSKEKDYAIDMLNKNRNLLIVDGSMNMEYTHEQEELWLDPSNFLMMAQNIRSAFNEFINNTYLKKEINDNYEQLKIDISQIDAEFNLIAENSIDKNIVVDNDLLLFLQKYQLNVYSLEENENLTSKTISDVEKLITSGKIKYIFVVDESDLNDTVKSLINKYDISVLVFGSGSNLSDDERNEHIDYIKIMNDNIEVLKKELYQ